ncbi:18K protein [Beet virus Q]|uniref:18K protein n=1 Tax=Beet virus Q TaxID=71972 RepID=O92515_9VIRU|nr:18K protein [Beet virus Q]CAA11461.1 18K protein [Beet virus Q]
MCSRANLAFSGLPALIATSPALVITANIDKDLSSHGRNEIVPNDYLSVARAEGQPLIAMRAGGEEITIINADSDSPTLIRTETLSKRPSSVGVEYGSFSRERIISLSKELTVEGEPSPISHKDNTRTVANLAMSAVAIAASVDAARRVRQNKLLNCKILTCNSLSV